MESQTLELKWSNYESNMIAVLQELYISDSLVDVTVKCGEFSLKAHKAVLSAFSIFFQKLLLDNPCKHPILIMTDIDCEDLKTIVEFIYQGRIHVSQQKLSQFLKTAEKLKIKGLSNFEDTNLNLLKQLETVIDSSSMECQTVELKWSNHESNMIAGLYELYISDSLVDVTVACGEFSLKGHKAVLSASSTFFQKLFLDKPFEQHILIMTDIDFEDLKAIVEFIYQGRIRVSQQKLSQVIKTAEKLKIKGLSNFEVTDLNPSEQLETDIDSCNPSRTWKHCTTQSHPGNSVEVQSGSSKNVIEDIQHDADEEVQTPELQHITGLLASGLWRRRLG